VTIGGSAASDRNVISGNITAGIDIENSSGEIKVQGNYIGPQANGTSFVASSAQESGVVLIKCFPSTAIYIGGSAAGEGNVISGNDLYGIYGSRLEGAQVKGNYIGGGASTGSLLTGGAQGDQRFGIYWDADCTNNTIGGSSASGDRNIITQNANGIVVIQDPNNLISRNLIYSNTSAGIDLQGAGNTNFASPVVSAFSGTSASGTAPANALVEVFKNTTGNCEDAMTYLGTATANGSGAWSLGSLTINNGESVTATATDNGTWNTSQLAGSCMVGLPIELLTFTVENINNEYAKLKWTTATETNNDYFTIEKTQDGINYEFVAKVDGAGNSTQVLKYDTNDFKPYKGVSYYRLKQTDFNGAYDYSELVAVEFGSLTSESGKFAVYPNPASSSNLNVLFDGAVGEEVLIVVHDVLGKEYYSNVFVLDSETLMIQLASGSDLSPGLYTISASSNDKLYNKKIIIQ
ncbi:MAG: right-handed parallel beta-helix repeat-containing protein, partial [Bacteroidetes bacterium]|nr:right-handed parallel beta-helix repeat-containing protein [Bacteroidota bacterium]